jgi:hypothetical protein
MPKFHMPLPLDLQRMPQVLPLYIVVMLAHGTTEPVVVENLEAFLGEHAQAFTTWLAPRCCELLTTDQPWCRQMHVEDCMWIVYKLAGECCPQAVPAHGGSIKGGGPEDREQRRRSTIISGSSHAHGACTWQCSRSRWECRAGDTWVARHTQGCTGRSKVCSHDILHLCCCWTHVVNHHHHVHEQGVADRQAAPVG